MTKILDQFDQLVERGLQVIPIWTNSKVPMQKGWLNWNLQSCRETFQRYPESNMGLLLGDIIDVEGDSEAANDFLLDVIGDYPHPSYTSSRSIHHLFRNPDPDLRIIRHEDIEFRGHKHQSVLPPSHHQGISYNWRECNFPIPEMPKSLLKFYFNIKYGKRKKRGHVGVWCAKCNSKVYIHKKRFNMELSVFKKLHTAWECKKCRVLDLRPICRMNSKEKYAKHSR